MAGKRQAGRQKLKVCVNAKEKRKSSMSEGPHSRKWQAGEAIQGFSDLLTKSLC